MEDRIKTKVVLLAAQKVKLCGNQSENGVAYQQINLSESPDGYTIVLSDGKASITLYFHNRVAADYRRVTELEDLYERLKKLSRP